MQGPRNVTISGHEDDGDPAVWCGLRQLYLTVSRDLDTRLRAAHQLPLSEYDLLRALANPGCAQRMTGLAVAVGLSPSGLTRAIERLEQRGLVHRLPCPVDRRGISAALTEEGKALLREATGTHDVALHASLLGVLHPQEAALLQSLSSRLAGAAPYCPAPAPSDSGSAAAADTTSESHRLLMEDRKAFNQQVIDTFRANAGDTSELLPGMPVILLTTTGAKSGKPRTAPIAFIQDGGHYVIVASKGGSPTHPDWFHNLVANPTVTVETGTETYQAHAEIVEGPERARLYEAASEVYPQFRGYTAQTERVIPIIVLARS
ncbi:MAG: nitroreductase/quinone reductase family protein [Thermomicrobiales bacterium]